MNEGPTAADQPEPDFDDLDPDGQLAELLDAPDRDRCPGARPVVSVDESDDPVYIREVETRCVATPRLVRRGAFHGNLAELHDAFAFVPRDPLAALRERWDAARPIVFHDVLTDDVVENTITHAEHERLSRPGGLAELIDERRAWLAPEFHRLPDDASAAPTERGDERGDERDIERVSVGWQPRERTDGAPPAPVSDLWLKTQRLSTDPEDASLRMRVSFGHEVEDDASRDVHRHRLVAELTGRVMPEVAELVRDGELRGLIGEWIKARPLFTQGIAYWNAPNGGALFHHDAFDEPLRGGQRGVLFAQLRESSTWIALSIDDLARRVLEFAELLEGGDLPWIRERLFPDAKAFESFLLLSRSREACAAELALPGCGSLGPIVNQGPEFTSLLADAGHAFVLSEGDVVLLPNHGLGKTCMHSVFCSGDDVGFGVSLAIRASPRPQSASLRRSARRGGGRRRR